MDAHPVVQACAGVFQATNKAERQAAEDATSNYLENDPSNALYALITAVPICQEADPGLAQLCAIRAKNFLKNEMKESHEVDMALVKNALLQSIPEAQDNTRRLLVECARVVHAEEEWDDLAPLLIAQLSESTARDKADPGARRQCLSALQLLYVITRQFKMVNIVSQQEQEETSSAFLPMLPPLFEFRDLRIAHMTLKVFESFVLLFTPSVLKDAELFSGWMNFMLTFASESRPAFDLSNSDYVLYVKCMKRIAGISYRMVQLACRKGKKRPKAAQYFVVNFSESFVNLWVAWLRFMAPLDHEAKQQHAKVTVSALRYLRECGGLEEVYPCLPIDELTTELLFPYFPFNEEDEELWASDVNEYLRRLKAVTGDKTDLRYAATKAMMTFVSMSDKNPFQDPSHLPTLLQFVKAGLEEPPSRNTDGYLHVLGMLHKFAKKVPGFANAMQEVLVNHIAPLLSNENSILRAKAIWICGLFAGIPFDDESQFELMLRAVLSALDDTEAPVRMQVVSSLANFLSLRKSRPFLRECLGPLTQECTRLANDNNSDFAVEALQALVEVFGPELSVQLGGICETLVQRCRALRFDLSQAMEAATHVDYDEDSQGKASENLSFALESTLRAVSSCVEGLGYETQPLQALQVHICDMVLEVLGDGDLDHTDIALQVFDRLVFFGKDCLDAKCWDVFDAMHRVLMEGSVDLFTTYLPILDNLCSHQPQEFTRRDRLEKVFDMCSKMFSDDISCIPSCRVAAAEVMAVMYQQLRPHRPAMDEAAEPLLNLTLQALMHHDSPDLRMGLCTVLMSAMYYDTAATLGSMDNCNATPFVLPSYCDFAEKRENRDKYLSTALGRKTHVIGICSYVSHALTTERPEAPQVAGRMMQLAATMVRQNLPAYEDQLVALQKLLSGERQAEDKAADEGYESDDSMAVEEGEEGEEDDNEDEEGFGGRGGEEDEDDLDDELETESALDAVCEIEALYSTVSQCPPEVQQQFLTAWPSMMADLPAAQQLSAQVIAARAQIRSAAAQLHAARAAADC